ncbi:22299_t:CDS:2, partial [Rhizophagus irregularis]
MSNLEGSCEVEMDLIVLTPELGDITDIQKTDEEVSLNSEKKSNSPNLPPVRAPSLVWQYYEKVIDDKGVVLHVKCNFCDQKYSAKTSTGTLNDHFKRKHSKIQPKGIGSIEAEFNNSQTRTTLPGKNHLDILDNFINWVIIECQAFRVVDSPSFKELIASFNPEFQVPSRQTVRKKIDNKYAQNKKIIIKMFQENDSRISFTSDIFSHPHTGQQIQEVTLKIFKDFSIATKASTITIDNGANQVTAMKLLSTALETNLQVDLNVIRCGAHTIALV